MKRAGTRNMCANKKDALQTKKQKPQRTKRSWWMLVSAAIKREHTSWAARHCIPAKIRYFLLKLIFLCQRYSQCEHFPAWQSRYTRRTSRWRILKPQCRIVKHYCCIADIKDKTRTKISQKGIQISHQCHTIAEWKLPYVWNSGNAYERVKENTPRLDKTKKKEKKRNWILP